MSAGGLPLLLVVSGPGCGIVVVLSALVRSGRPRCSCRARDRPRPSSPRCSSDVHRCGALLHRHRQHQCVAQPPSPFGAARNPSRGSPTSRHCVRNRRSAARRSSPPRSSISRISPPSFRATGSASSSNRSRAACNSPRRGRRSTTISTAPSPWLVPYYQHSQIEGQLAGLAALFNAPLTIGELRVDVAIAFGVNDEFEGSNAQRLAAALVAAERAIRTRALWTKYTPRQKDDAGWQLSFHSQLEDALTGGDIWVAFQPQYEIATRRLVGVEALARWTHPTRGPIPPDEFIVQAEKSQDIYRLTLFVMDQAIRSAAQLHERGFHINMSVNLSATLLDHSDLVGTIRVMLTAHHLPPEILTIEITETAQIENSRQARQTLAQLRRTGIRLSIDDYGTGQSNLEYLTEIEADEIKIDKRFVMTMRDSQRNLEVVKSTIDLAHRLGAVAVAEGIEDAETMTLLGQLGCDVGQGYHLGKPQLFSELAATLSAPPQNRTA